MEKNIVKTWCACAAVVLMLFSAGIVCAEPPAPEEMAELGEKIFFDKISAPDSMSCAECHGPNVGWTGPNPGVNKDGSVYPGAVPQRFGNRKPPSSGYATLSPVFYYDGENFVGGNFWDGRATGWLLGNPAADQALGPFLNPVEQNNADEFAVIDQICTAKYADQFVRLFLQYAGGKIDPCGTIDEDEIKAVYNFVGLAIAAYEDSEEVNSFSSKYDFYLAECQKENPIEECGMPSFNADKEEFDPNGILSEQEWYGLQLFVAENDNLGEEADEDEGGTCFSCHPTIPLEGDNHPIFTDFTYDNLGIPRNPENPFYDMDEVYLDDGTPINPQGEEWVDLGLGGFLLQLVPPDSNDWAYEDWQNWDYANLSNMKDWGEERIRDEAKLSEGKHKVPTLRNVDKRPGDGFLKAYGHNGYFKSLQGIVHFYNTRDVKQVCDENTWFTEEEALAADCWPAHEISAHVNIEELGNLGLSTEQEEALAAFMATLSDGYDPKKDKVK